MELAIKNALKKRIPDIYEQYKRGHSLDDIAGELVDDLMVVIRKKYKCDVCSEKLPKSNIDSKD
jgi:hypothetical protein